MEMEITEAVYQDERQEITIEEAASGEYPCVIEDSNTVTMWVMVEDESDDKCDYMWLASLSSFPWPYPDKKILENHKIVPMHLVECEIDNLGIEEVFGLDSKDNTLEKFMEREGIVAFQPFQVRVRVEYFRCGAYDCEDWDSTSCFDIIEKGKVPES